MLKEILERAAAGDPEATIEIEEWAGSTDAVSLDRLIKILEKSKEQRADESEVEAKFWADLMDIKAAINSAPKAAGTRLQEMAARARALGACESVQVLGLTAARRMLLGELEAAGNVLLEARGLALSCRLARPGLSPCGAFLDRREALLHLAYKRAEAALSMIQGSIEVYRRCPNCGHDLNGDGEGSSLHARGEIRFEMRDYDEAVVDWSACLDRFRPENSMWLRAHQNLTLALSRTGPVGRRKAHQMLGRQRLVVRSRENTVEGSTFLWVDGQLMFSLGIRRDRAITKMKKALAGFAKQGMPDHYENATLDIALAYYPRRDLISRFLAGTKRTRQRLIGVERDRQTFEEIYTLVEGDPDENTLKLLEVALLAGRASEMPSLLGSITDGCSSDALGTLQST